ncbi:hypothetical protein B296_00000377 [Ensete ventricosum]|uniref:Uncharacterized protein n=1 Tax=Ensete ventricosum TaxID=4639 RepID=A0A427BBL6_ENSVE|nr:hypothetical protein B296_00000377 [Ensete ventricosum]
MWNPSMLLREELETVGKNGLFCAPTAVFSDDLVYRIIELDPFCLHYHRNLNDEPLPTLPS